MTDYEFIDKFDDATLTNKEIEKFLYGKKEKNLLQSINYNYMIAGSDKIKNHFTAVITCKNIKPYQRPLRHFQIDAYEKIHNGKFCFDLEDEITVIEVYPAEKTITAFSKNHW